ncbi:MAG: CaiB/BaiF CoA-transferase family protein [Alphaproteobacteria bacterium]|nr:CaiB/BaiF CoA-transferase family protein [Alphaproteobacteria bacterium]
MPEGKSAQATQAGENATLPLSGIRVVEFSHMVMGPTCGLILADLGADVIKVEPAPDGDKTRSLTGSGAGFFAAYNRNKRSIAVDIKSPKGKAFVERLIATADVLVENFRPGALDAMGLGYETLKQSNPGLIYCSAKGFLAGPYEKRTALDEVVQMMGGLAYMTGPPGRPLRAGASVNDVMGGMFGAIGVLAALRQREITGKGSEVISALFENCAFLSGQHMAQFATTGKPAAPMPARLSAWAVYDVFDCSDEAQVFVGVVSDRQWKTFCEDFNLPELLADPSLDTNPKRCHARDTFLPKIRDLFRTIPSEELMEKCEHSGLPYAPIRRPEDLFDDPHLKQSGGLLDITLPNGTETQIPALPISVGGWRPGVRRDIPRSGQHSQELAQELGFTVDEIDALKQSGTVNFSD